MMRLLSAILLFGVVQVPGYADADRGLEIAKTMRERDRGFGNFTADMEMTLISANGKRSLRRLRVKVLEVEGDGDKNLAIFDAPADVKGAAFLSHTHIRKPDDQWLYLPSLKRVKRIAPANKTAPFMGSEFSYEDLASPEVEKYTYNYLGEDAAAGRPSFLLERYPVDKHSGYSRQLVWVDRDRYVALKIEFFDRRGDKLKTLVSSGFKQYLDRYWRATGMDMENHQSGKRSVLNWANYRFRQNINAQDFRPTSLSRMR
ncbi:MAG: outer membrane lipoprotein-sorting protein [Betaproteobacteria bacterium]|jgi:outer membrane lipoprotein-sorting protein|nr:MAG: outer membrane lipoprotein-sorting protein [Betaproteobacteria bacterium]